MQGIRHESPKPTRSQLPDSLDSSPRSTSDYESSPIIARDQVSPIIARDTIRSRIDQLIQENTCKLDGAVSSKSDCEEPLSVKANSPEESPLRRIDKLLAKNETIAQSEIEMRRLQQQQSLKTKPTLDAKIQDVKSRLRRDLLACRRKQLKNAWQ